MKSPSNKIVNSNTDLGIDVKENHFDSLKDFKIKNSQVILGQGITPVLDDFNLLSEKNSEVQVQLLQNPDRESSSTLKKNPYKTLKQSHFSLSDNQLKSIEQNNNFIKTRAFRFTSYKEKSEIKLCTKFPYKKVIKIDKKIDKNLANRAISEHSFVKKERKTIKLDKEKENHNNSFEAEVAPFVDPINNIFLTSGQPEEKPVFDKDYKKKKVYKDIYGDDFRDIKHYKEINLVPFTLLEPVSYKNTRKPNFELEENARKVIEDPDFLIKLSRPVLNKTNTNFNNFMTNPGVKKGYSGKEELAKKLESMSIQKQKNIQGDTQAYFYHKDENLMINLAPMKKLLTTQNFYRNKLNLEKITNEIGIMTSDSTDSKVNRVETIKNLINSIVSTPSTRAYNITSRLNTAEQLPTTSNSFNPFKNNSIFKALSNKTFSTKKKFDDIKEMSKLYTPLDTFYSHQAHELRKNSITHQNLIQEDFLITNHSNFHERAQSKAEILKKKDFGFSNYYNIGINKFNKRFKSKRELLKLQRINTVDPESQKREIKKLSKEDLSYNVQHLMGAPKAEINKKSREKFIKNKEKKLVDTLYKIIDKEDVDRVFNRLKTAPK